MRFMGIYNFSAAHGNAQAITYMVALAGGAWRVDTKTYMVALADGVRPWTAWRVDTKTMHVQVGALHEIRTVTADCPIFALWRQKTA